MRGHIYFTFSVLPKKIQKHLRGRYPEETPVWIKYGGISIRTNTERLKDNPLLSIHVRSALDKLPKEIFGGIVVDAEVEDMFYGYRPNGILRFGVGGRTQAEVTTFVENGHLTTGVRIRSSGAGADGEALQAYKMIRSGKVKEGNFVECWECWPLVPEDAKRLFLIKKGVVENFKILQIKKEKLPWLFFDKEP